MRLDKYLADGAVGTRSTVKKIIKEKRVTVNGTTVTDAGINVSYNDLIEVDGKTIRYEEFEYYMLNKPQGVISESRKNSLKRGEKIPESFSFDSEDKNQSVVDLITESGKIDLFPCGRLDKDTEGLLLITNDGQLAHRLLSPKHHVEKTYYAELSGELTENDRKKIENGIDIGDEKPTLPSKIEIITESSVNITITEGRYHQVKRMFEAVGLKVIFLKRISFGCLTLDDKLKPGEYRKLTEAEISELLG